MSASSPVWLGVDVGTAGVRAAAYDADGHLVAEGVAERPPRAPSPGAMVHHPEDDWWGGAVEALGSVLARVDPQRIAGIGLSGLFPAACLVDRDGRALGDALLYGDTRAAPDVEALGREVGSSLTGDEVAPRLRWLRRTAPEQVERAVLVLGPAGFVGFRLTGRPSVDPHSAARWGGLANAARDGWDEVLAGAVGVGPGALPPIVPPDRLIGVVTHEAAAVSGLPAGVPVVAGATDSFCDFVGNGLRGAGDAIVYYGSSGTLLVCTDDLEAATREPRRFGPDRPYRLAAYVPNSGSFVERARRELVGDLSYAELDALAADRAPGAEGVVVLPHVSGRFVPHRRPEARGAVVGLLLHHDRGHLWRAVLESFGYVLREAAGDLDRPLRRVVASGGGARSAPWRQIVSDITGWTQHLAPPGGSARGAAFLAAHGLAGLGFDAVRGRWLAVAGELPPTVPDPLRAGRYDAAYHAWQSVDRALTALEGGPAA